MVLIDGNKYACETCIKGHRSSTCRHTDRPLFEIKKKGRPVTQCEHCRELRKTKQVHVKCICETKEDHAGVQPSSHKKGHTNIPDSATFPHGLPEAMGASAARHTSSEGASSDSDHGGFRSGCTCKIGGACHCCTTRKSAPKSRRKDVIHPPQAAPDSYDILSSSTASSSRTPSHILARLAELRPVLPRPVGGPLHHHLSGYQSRHHSHENLLFSPYGRAYDLTHEQVYDHVVDQGQTNASQDAFSAIAPPIPTDEQIFRDQLRALEAAAASNWAPSPLGASIPTGASFPSTCGCGDDCRCPGCVQHNGTSIGASSSAFSSCANPGICSTCLDCTILSLPASLPPDTSLSIFDAYQTDSIDEWIRQVSSLPRSSPTPLTSTNPIVNNIVPVEQSQQQQTPWEGFLPPIVEPKSPRGCGYVVQECCGVLCKCSPELCECDINNENGYDCRREIANTPFPASVTNAGEGIHPADTESAQFLALPDVLRSRSSSMSSQSSLGPPRRGFDNLTIATDYSIPIGRIRGPFSHAGSFSSPDLGMSLRHDFRNLSGTSSMSPSRSRSTMSASPTRHMRGSVTYAISNPDSDGYGSMDDRYPSQLCTWTK